MVAERSWSPLVTVVPYVLLVILAAFTVAMKHAQPRSLLIDLALCAVAAGWMVGMFTLRPAWHDRPRIMGVFFAGLIVIMAVLVLRDPWFGCFTPAGYFYAFRLLPWPWLLPGVAVVAIVSGTAQAYGLDTSSVIGVVSFVGVLAINVVPMCAFAWRTWRNARRDDERDRALDEAREANRRLEASLEENAGLHRRLMDQAREAGVLDERQRMAREIHDTLAQGLAGIITQLQAAEQADGDRDGRRRHVSTATALARESLTEARRSVHALRPEPLRTARLGDALAEAAARWSARHDVCVQVTTTGTARPVPPDAEVALLRIAQEALANVAKHASASRVGLTLSYLDDQVALDVRDDGRGFPTARLDGAAPAAPGDGPAGEAPAGDDDASGGFGLVAMRQRIEALAGTLRIESEPGAGTAISAAIPSGAGA